jgi:hypothetical protein
MNNRPDLDRKAADTLYRNHFGAFVYAAFGVVNPGLILKPNWHIDCVCHHLQLMVAGRNARRLVLNQPPRSLQIFHYVGGPAGVAVGSKSQLTDNLCELFGGSRQQVLARLPLSY